MLSSFIRVPTRNHASVLNNLVPQQYVDIDPMFNTPKNSLPITRGP